MNTMEPHTPPTIPAVIELQQLRRESAEADCPKVLLKEWRELLQAAGLKIYKDYAEAGIFPSAPVPKKNRQLQAEEENPNGSNDSCCGSDEQEGTSNPLCGAVGPDDLLFIIDMQNDFLPPKGTFGVPEGNSATHTILSKYMLRDFLNNPVFLSRDYHPVDHCSFQQQNGPFPSHCIQGTWGAHFEESIGRAISVRRHLRHDQKLKRIVELDKLEVSVGTAMRRHSESRNYQAYLSATSTNSLSSVGGLSNNDDGTSEMPEESTSSVPPFSSPNTEFATSNNVVRENVLLDPAVGETKVVFKGFSPDIDSFGAAPYAHSDHHASASTRLSLRPADLNHSSGCEHLGEVGTPMTTMQREDTVFATVETHITPITRSPIGDWPNSPKDDNLLPDSPHHVPTRKNFCSPAWTGAFILRSSNEPHDVNAPPDVMSVLNKREVLKDVENLFHRRSRDRSIVRRALRPDGKHPTQLPNAFICGLALDFCVVDTAINVSRHCSDFFGNVCILLDGCRAAHIPGHGKYGSGFMTNPAEFTAWVNSAGVKVIDLSMGDEIREAAEAACTPR